MAGVVACVAGGVTWCFCTAVGSLLGSCCGNDKPSTIAPGAASGRRRSVLLLVLSIAIAFAFQYGVAASIVDFEYSNFVTDAWLDGCKEYDNDDDGTAMLVERCAGNAGVYRSAFSAFLFFVLAGIAVMLKPTANREAWPAKYVLFCFLVVAMCFVPNDPLFNTVYLNIARVGGVLFVMVQQIILVDLAHNWNDSWVEKSNKAEAEEPGSGKKWLAAILVSAAFCFLVSIVGWGLMLHYFSGCSSNVGFISVTIILCIGMVLAQMSGEEGSLLSSGIICVYATSLCYSAVAKNPDAECNPFLDEDDVLGIMIGVGFTVVSLGYAGWSMTADEHLSGKSLGSDSGETAPEDVKEEPAKDSSGNRKIAGVVANYGTDDTEDDKAEEDADVAGEAEEAPNTFSNSWKLNFILAVVTCWYAMALTGWGSIKSGGSVANPDVGRTSMWMIIASQWIVLVLYVWTLVAPRLCPNRDFS